MEKAPNLYLRVSWTERKTFTCKRRLNGSHKRETLGTFPELSLKEARQRAQEMYLDIQRGEDPFLDHSENTERFKELVDEYLEEYLRRHLCLLLFETFGSWSHTCNGQPFGRRISVSPL